MIIGERIETLAGDVAGFGALTFPGLRRALSPLAKPWFAVGVREGGEPIGLALGWRDPDSDEAQLLSVSVARAHRRRGLGVALLQAWRALATELGADTLITRHSGALPARLAFEAALRRAEWPPPQLQMLYMAGQVGPMVEKVAMWPALRGRLLGETGVDFAAWTPPDAADRAEIERLSAQALFWPRMAPVLYEDDLDPAASIAVRRGGRLIGWVLAQPVSRAMPGVPTGRHALYYPSAYIDQAAAPTGALVAGYWHAFARQSDAYGAESMACLHTAAPRMQAMVRRRFGPIAVRVDETFETRFTPTRIGATSP